MKSKGRRIALVVTAIGISTILLATVSLRTRIAEEWWLWKLDSANQEIKQAAGKRLCELGSARAVPKLIEYMRTSDRSTDLWKIGEPAVPEMLRALKASSGSGPHRGWRRYIARDLGQIQSRASIAPLIEITRDEDRALRIIACEALMFIGPAAKEAIPALADALDDPEQMVRDFATRALEKIADDAERKAIQSRVPDPKGRAARIWPSKRGDRQGRMETHLLRLQTTPGYLRDIVDMLEDSREGEALVVYARTEEGKEALARLLLEETLSAIGTRSGGLANAISSTETALFSIACNPLPTAVCSIDMFGMRRGGGQQCEGTRLPAIYKTLCAGGLRKRLEFSLPNWPGSSFTVLPGDLAFLMTGFHFNDGVDVPMRDKVVMLARPSGKAAMRPACPCVLPLLVGAMSADDDEMKKLAIDILPAFRVDRSDPVPGLLRLLKDDGLMRTHGNEPWIRCPLNANSWFEIHPAARALMDLGPGILPALTVAVKEESGRRAPQRSLPGRDRPLPFQAMLVYERLGEASIPFLEELDQMEDVVLYDLVPKALERVRTKSGTELVPVAPCSEAFALRPRASLGPQPPQPAAAPSSAEAPLQIATEGKKDTEAREAQAQKASDKTESTVKESDPHPAKTGADSDDNALEKSRPTLKVSDLQYGKIDADGDGKYTPGDDSVVEWLLKSKPQLLEKAMLGAKRRDDGGIDIAESLNRVAEENRKKALIARDAKQAAAIQEEPKDVVAKSAVSPDNPPSSAAKNVAEIGVPQGIPASENVKKNLQYLKEEIGCGPSPNSSTKHDEGQRPVNYQVRVLNDGKPAEDVSIGANFHANGLFGTPFSRVVRSRAITDAEGKYKGTVLVPDQNPNGLIEITAYHSTLGFAFMKREIKEVEDKGRSDEYLELNLQVRHVISGRVVDEQGAPVERLVVMLMIEEGNPGGLLASNGWDITDSNGHFRINGNLDGNVPFRMSLRKYSEDMQRFDEGQGVVRRKRFDEKSNAWELGLVTFEHR